jgi:hypothetical protein
VYDVSVGVSRGALLVAIVLLVAVAMSVACNFGIDTSGLVGDGGQTTDVTLDSHAESGHVEDAHGDARGTDGAKVDGGDLDGGVDAGDAGSDAPMVPCTIAAVQAVPGTGTYHVMQDGGSEQQFITETAGNLLVAVAYGGQGPGQTTPLTTVPNMKFTVTDTLGNTFHAAAMYENTNSNQAAIQIFYATNILPGANTVTVTSTTADGLMLQTGLFLQEYSGMAITDVVDVSSGQMAPSMTTQVVPPAVTTVTSCDLVVGAFTDGHVDGQPLDAGPGWTLRSTDRWDPGGAVDNAPTGGAPAHSVVAAEIDLSGGADDGWVAAQVAFRAASTSAPTQPDEIGFATPPQTVSAGSCSNVVTLRSDHGGSPAVTATGIDVELSGPGLAFYIDSSCKYPITDVYIGAGTYSQSFHFIGASKGSPIITATPKPGPPAAIQTETID